MLHYRVGSMFSTNKNKMHVKTQNSVVLNNENYEIYKSFKIILIFCRNLNVHTLPSFFSNAQPLIKKYKKRRKMISVDTELLYIFSENNRERYVIFSFNWLAYTYLSKCQFWSTWMCTVVLTQVSEIIMNINCLKIMYPAL